MRRLRPAGIRTIGIRTIGILAIGFTAWIADSTAARAQGVLPPTGVDTRVGDLRGYFTQAFGQLPTDATTHGWTYSAAIDASETYDTGVPVSSNGGTIQAHDLITRIGPSIGITGDSARLVGSLFYSPTLNIYAIHGNQNNISHNLNADVTATVVPDFFFVDLRAYAAEQAINGFNGPANTTDVSSSNEELTTSFSVAPTLRHSFQTLANAELGASLSRTEISANNQVQTSTAEAVNQNFTTEEAHATVSTGEDFGQFSDSLSAQASTSSGTGNLQGATSSTVTNTFSYAATRTIVLTASIGHEDYSYGGSNPYVVDDVTWSGGLIWTPDPDSNVSLGYGHQQGGSSFYLNASYATSAFTRVYARYSQGIGTEGQNLQNAVNSTTVNSSGVLVDRATGIPVSLNNNFFPTQPGLYRTTSASVSGVLLWPRDLFNVGLQYQETTQLTSGFSNTPGSSSSSSGEFVSFSWEHDLSEDLHANFSLQYGVNSGSNFGTNGSTGNQGSILVNVGLTYAISETLSTSFQLTYTNQPSYTGTNNNSYTGREIAVVSIHKTF